MSDVTTLDGYATELLALCAAALAETDAGAPTVQFVSPGEPALDCPEMLAVFVTGLAPEQTQPTTPAPAAGHRHRPPGMVILASFAIVAARCIPVPNPPRTTIVPADKLTSAAARTNQDVWAIWNRLYWAAHDGSLFGGSCKSFYFDTPAPLPIAGQTAGWTMRLRASIDGYQPAGS